MKKEWLVEYFRRVLNRPSMPEEDVCKIIKDLAMKSYWRGELDEAFYF